MPTRLVLGKGTLVRLPELMKPYKRILLAYGGGSIIKTGLYDEVKTVLRDKELVELAGIAPNPKVQSAREGVRLIREHRCEAILAVGGGSVIDLCKLISAAVSYDGDPWDLVLDSTKIDNDRIMPLYDVLTMAATGSEYDNSGVISNPDTCEKIETFGNLHPKASILDPTYSFTVPAFQTAAGSADIMSHTFECYLVKEGTTFTDGVCEAMLRTVIKNAPIAVRDPENFAARAELMQCASFGCSGLLAYGMYPTAWVCHAIEHELSAFTDITHGAGLAIITPQWMRYSLTDDTVGRFAQYGVNVWGLDPHEDKFKIATDAIEKTAAFFRELGLPSKLSELGVTDAHFEEMTDHMLKIWYGDFSKALRPIDRAGILEILKAAL